MKATSGRGQEALACCHPCPPASPPLGSPCLLSSHTGSCGVSDTPLPLASLRAWAPVFLQRDACSIGGHPSGMSSRKCYLLKDTLPVEHPSEDPCGVPESTLAPSSRLQARSTQRQPPLPRPCCTPVREPAVPRTSPDLRTRSRSRGWPSPHCVSGTLLGSSKGQLAHSVLRAGVEAGWEAGRGSKPPCTGCRTQVQLDPGDPGPTPVFPSLS